MPGPVFLRGERVTLRPIEREDAHIVQRAYNEPEFHDGFLLNAPSNRETIESQIERREADDDSIVLFVCVDETPVGRVYVRDIEQDHGMLGYWLLPEERGHGYTTEGAAVLVDHVFEIVGLHRVFAWTIDDNDASQRLLRRLGFSHEGTYREHVFTRGAYRDTEHYGLLSSEWPGVDAVLDDWR
ncbi:acetyltransferase [Haloprofundus marisrubri]|uniref:Acetyltransferase n=1 Tax=Haloprofundus marisrubri TaxID=1514971 RepID=A0A0W1RBC8_9EURY|nr:GNAT family protein [Haloprofundus marisrubri]KTG10802.1 acetyltransferase [Haloprofundus marisrubri]